MSFDVHLTANPWLLGKNCLNKICRTMYHLQLSFKNLVLIRNRNGVKSCSRLACQAVSDPRLSKILLSVEILVLLIFVGPKQAC